MQMTTLHHDEVVRLDTARLQAVCDQLGYARAEAEIGTRMEDLAVLLNRVEAVWRTGDLTGLHEMTGRIGILADGVGMRLLCRVAGDVMQLCVAHDDAALGAVMARLDRLGEASLLAVWRVQDQSM